MAKEYFVLFKRDRDGESMARTKGRMLYDALRQFSDHAEAKKFALRNLQHTPLLAKTIISAGDYCPAALYVVAAYFTDKYGYTDISGVYNSQPTHEVEVCNQQALERIVEHMASEGPDRMYLGIEEKLLPTPFDRIRSVNGLSECET